MSISSCTKKILSFFLFVPMITFGQASLKGTVRDASNEESMVGVSVILEGTALGAATNIEGQFRIVGIPERVYKIKVSCLGYEPQIFEIDFSQTKDVAKNIQLRPSIIEGEEVVVTGQMRGQTAAINQQVTSNTIINVISEEKIKELPDVNAAEAIGRLPGVSIQRSGGEASKVVLRGLSAKFSNIMIDGVTIPGTDKSSKDVDLSMISQGSLAGIELRKALTPDQDADAIAGSVNLVTRKAPSEREIRIELRGGYNHLMKSNNLYDISGRYGGRFFDDILGVQIQGNSERKIRSKENIDYEIAYRNLPTISGPYDAQYKVNDYYINEFTVEFTDEVRTRNGGKIIFDINTPDSGSIKISGLYSETRRDMMIYYAHYPAGQGGYLDLVYRNREINISTVNTSIQGRNFLLDLDIDWGFAYAHSLVKNPYDYQLKFNPHSTWKWTAVPEQKDHPEDIINAYQPIRLYDMACSVAIYRQVENFDKDKTAWLNLAKKYTILDYTSGELKMGAKYKVKDRWMKNSQSDNPTYLYNYGYNIDGSAKNFAGTIFESFYPPQPNMLSISYFMDNPASARRLMDIYLMYPLINKDALRLWYTLNKNGSGEYFENGIVQMGDYGVTERVFSSFLMNTLNIGQEVTIITGIRVEQEKNDYLAKMLLGSVAGTVWVVANGEIKDTTAQHKETNFLPNIQLAVRPTDYLTVRFAAYKALARPDYDLRLPRFYVGSSSSDFGNPNLKNAKAWNYEVNTQLFGSLIGLVSISAFYKVIDDLYHDMEATTLSGDPDSINYPLYSTLNSIGVDWLKDPRNNSFVRRALSGGTLNVSVPYNSPEPSYAWGFEFEHQMNFSFLPVSFLKPITLSYNISITRSETNIYVQDQRTDSTLRWENVAAGTGEQGWQWVPQNIDVYFIKLEKRQSEGQPNLYGNAALGYDIGGFSARLSVFYQDEYVELYSFNGRRDKTVDSFTKWDLALKQDISHTVSLYLNINNLTNQRESKSLKNNFFGWVLPRAAELYGTTVNLGVRVSF